MRHTIDTSKKDLSKEIFNYIYDYMASLAGDESNKMDKSKIQIMINPSDYKKVPTDNLYGIMNQHPIFVKFEGVDEVVPFAKRENDIFSGLDLINQYSEEDRTAFQFDPEAEPVRDPGKISEPGRIARFLKKYLHITTRAMREYEEKQVQKELFDRQQARNESARLAAHVDESDLAEDIQERERARGPVETKDERKSALAEAAEAAEEEQREAQRQADLEEQLDDNLKLGGSLDENLRVGDQLTGPAARREEILANKKIIVDTITSRIMGQHPGENIAEVAAKVSTSNTLREMLSSPNKVQSYAEIAKTNADLLMEMYEEALEKNTAKIRSNEKRQPNRKKKLDELNKKRERSQSMDMSRK